MPDRLHYSIYPNRQARYAAHSLFWLLILLFMCFVNAMVFREVFWDRLTVLYSLGCLPLVMAGHYLFCHAFMGKKQKWKLIVGSLLIVIWYVSVLLAKVLLLKILSGIFEDNVYVAALSAYYQINDYTEVFAHKHFIGIFESFFIYNIFALGFKIAVDFYEVQREAYEAAKERNRMETAFLRTRTRPQFLLDTLDDVRQSIPASHSAQEAIRRLAELMHFSLFDTAKKEIPLREEIHFLQNYIDLEKMRHEEDRVQITLDTAEIDEMGLPIGSLLLINFVENAFKHGVNARAGQAYVHITLRTRNGVLAFHIVNNKPVRLSPVRSSPKKRGGIGLANVKRRLQLEYADRHTLTIKDTEEEFEVELVLKS